MGLLDIANDPMMGMAMGLLQASGPSSRPVSLGQGLAQGYQGMQEAQQNGMRQKMFQQQQEMHQFQFDQAKKQAKASDDAKAQLQAYLTGLPDTDPKKATITQALQMGVPMEKVWERINPQKELKEVKTFSYGGKDVPVQVFKDGTMTPADGFGVPSDIKLQDVGGRLVAIDNNALKPGQSISKTMSPSEFANFEIANQRLAFDESQAGKPVFNADAGGWITPPAAMAPGQVSKVDMTGKPLNESQGAAANFGTRAAKAHAILADLESQGINKPGFIKRNVEAIPLAGDYLASSGPVNWTQSAGQQQVEQAKSDFISAVLRKESGASISPIERSSADKQYFPQPGDSDETIAQKSANRKTAIDGLALQAGPAAEKVNAAGGVDLQALAAQELAKRKGKR